jgi:excisionase family DNA binding protein
VTSPADSSGKRSKSVRPQAARPDQRLLTLQEAATVLGLSVTSIRRLIASGRLPALRLVRHLRVDVRDVEALITDARRRGPWV